MRGKSETENVLAKTGIGYVQMKEPHASSVLWESGFEGHGVVIAVASYVILIHGQYTAPLCLLLL